MDVVSLQPRGSELVPKGQRILAILMAGFPHIEILQTHRISRTSSWHKHLFLTHAVRPLPGCPDRFKGAFRMEEAGIQKSSIFFAA
jgi:hypothetical protein